MANIKQITNKMIDKIRGRLSNSSDTYLFINLIPFEGIISFQEPDIEIEYEKIYSQHNTSPLAIVEKNRTIGDGSLTILESSLLLAKAEGYALNSEMVITKLIAGDLVKQDLRQLKVYTGVIPKAESRSELMEGHNAFTVDVTLEFTREPFIVALPI